MTSLVAQLVKNRPAMRETWAASLGWEDPLEKGMATHSSILAWKIPWTEEPFGIQSMESQRVRHDWEFKPSTSLWGKGKSELKVCLRPSQHLWAGQRRQILASETCQGRCSVGGSRREWRTWIENLCDSMEKTSDNRGVQAGWEGVRPVSWQ